MARACARARFRRWRIARFGLECARDYEPTFEKRPTIHLARFPRVRFAHLPTPLEPMPNLTRLLGGPQLYAKRDDCTGLATGGNKTRKLEFLIGEALAQGADTVITRGAVQSNHVRQTAAAACRYGLKCVALLERRGP